MLFEGIGKSQQEFRAPVVPACCKLSLEIEAL